MGTVVDVMRMGFYDCVFHPFPSGYLVTSVNKGIRASSIQQEKAKGFAAIASQEGNIQAMVQSMSDGLIVTDLNQNVIFCNPKAAELLGKEIPAGIPIGEIIDQTTKLSVDPMELEIETPTGTVLMRTVSVMDRPTSRIGWVSILTDVTGSEKSSETALGYTREVRASLAANEREAKVIDSEKYILLSDLDTGFKDEISREPGGENIMHCFNCGTCVAGCPVRWIN